MVVDVVEDSDCTLRIKPYRRVNSTRAVVDDMLGWVLS